MTLRTPSSAALAFCIVASLNFTEANQTKPEGGANSVNVTVKYAGKGVVDANHRLWAWLFTTPDIGPGSIPIAEESIQKYGGTITFANVSAKEVYIAVAYDEAGGFVGNAPPPPGSPIALYGVKTGADQPVPVVPGPKGSVTLTFNDAQRMQ